MDIVCYRVGPVVRSLFVTAHYTGSAVIVLAKPERYAKAGIFIPPRLHVHRLFPLVNAVARFTGDTFRLHVYVSVMQVHTTVSKFGQPIRLWSTDHVFVVAIKA